MNNAFGKVESCSPFYKMSNVQFYRSQLITFFSSLIQCDSPDKMNTLWNTSYERRLTSCQYNIMHQHFTQATDLELSTD